MSEILGSATITFDAHNSNSHVISRNLKGTPNEFSKHDEQNTSVDDQLILSLDLNSDINMMDRRISDDTKSELHDANCKGEHMNRTEQTIPLVSSTYLHNH